MANSKLYTTLLALLGLGLLTPTGPALALEPIAVPDGVEAVSGAAPGEGCPQLTRIKYPFLSCSTDQYGNVTLDPVGTGLGAAVENFHEFVNGPGNWGPVLTD